MGTREEWLRAIERAEQREAEIVWCASCGEDTGYRIEDYEDLPQHLIDEALCKHCTAVAE